MSKTALIVEDEIFVALDLERILTDAGYTGGGIAADRASALKAALGCGIAFVDVNLRDGPTGPDIAKSIAREYGIKVVFVSGYAEDASRNSIYIGRSEVAMWMRVVSSWVCIILYGWSLLAPVIMPDR